MTKKQLEAYRRLYDRLERMGFDGDECDQLCRIERTLSRWAARECNGEVEVDDETGFAFHIWDDGRSMHRYRVPNRESGAVRRLIMIMAGHPDYLAYHQTDPRGCALYIVAKSDIPEGCDIGSYYTRGVAVCA